MATQKYLDFDLRIERDGEAFRAVVLNSPVGGATSRFALPFTEEKLENYLLKIGQRRSNVRRMQTAEMLVAEEFGSRLFDAVFTGELAAVFRSSLDQAAGQDLGLRVRLRLDDAPQLADLPWEYLYQTKTRQFLTLSIGTPIVRYLEVPERIKSLGVRPPLRALVMISSPTDHGQLDVEREWGKLREALAETVSQGLLILDRLDRATLPELQVKLRKHEYHIFHFIGHGGFDPGAQEGALLLEDDQKRGRLISGEEIGTFLHDEKTLRLAVLNACEGARSSVRDPFSGVAQSLVLKGIPAVIAMQFEVSDEAAITLAHEFYGAVADGYPVDAALAEARKAIFGRCQNVEWGTPVLYLRSPDGQIFDIQKPKDETALQARTDMLLREARAAALAEDWSVAVAKLEAVLALKPQHPDVTARLTQAREGQEFARLYAEGCSHQDAGRWREAAGAFERLAGRPAGNKDVTARLALVQQKLAEATARKEPPPLIEERLAAPPLPKVRDLAPTKKFSPLIWLGIGSAVVLVLVAAGIVISAVIGAGSDKRESEVGKNIPSNPPSAPAVEISVGTTRLSIPSPAGYSLITSDMQPYAEFAKRSVPPSNEQFALFLPEADAAAAARGEIPNPRRWFTVQTTKVSIEHFFATADFAQLKRMMKTQNEGILKDAESEIPGLFEKLNKGISADYNVDVNLSLDRMVPLPPHYETERVLSFSMLVKVKVNDAEGKPSVFEGAVTTTLVHLQGTVLFLYVNAEKSEFEWGRSESRKWTDAVIAANPSTGEIAAREKNSPSQLGSPSKFVPQEGSVPAPVDSKPTPGNGPKYPDTEAGARALLSEFLKPDADCKALTRPLQPTKEDYRSVFELPFADRLINMYDAAWTSGALVIAPNPGQTEVLVESVPSAEIRSWSRRAEMILPGGYRSLGNDIKEGHTIYRFKFVAPGKSSGLAFDGLVFVNGHWCIFPKPWRAKEK